MICVINDKILQKIHEQFGWYLDHVGTKRMSIVAKVLCFLAVINYSNMEQQMYLSPKELRFRKKMPICICQYYNKSLRTTILTGFRLKRNIIPITRKQSKN